eukprot:6185372-Pleurochrysis_carterae.AAC.3
MRRPGKTDSAYGCCTQSASGWMASLETEVTGSLSSEVHFYGEMHTGARVSGEVCVAASGWMAPQLDKRPKGRVNHKERIDEAEDNSCPSRERRVKGPCWVNKVKKIGTNEGVSRGGGA